MNSNCYVRRSVAPAFIALALVISSAGAHAEAVTHSALRADRLRTILTPNVATATGAEVEETAEVFASSFVRQCGGVCFAPGTSPEIVEAFEGMRQNNELPL